MKKDSQKNSSSGVSLVSSSAKMASATMLSRVLGLAREQVMAFTFGAGAATDAFLVAFRIPNLLRDLLAEGAFSSAFVPSFVSLKEKSLKDATELMKTLLVQLFLITALIALLIFLFAPALISLFAPTFEGEVFKQTVTLTRIMSPYLICVSLTALFVGVLNSLKVFFLPALSSALFNVAFILSLLFLPPLFGNWGLSSVLTMGVGVLIGGVCQVFLQIPQLYQQKMAPGLPEKYLCDESKNVLKKLGPGLIGFSATQINLIVITILATQTFGAVSWLNYSFRLFQFPVGVLSVSLAGGHLVYFSEKWKTGRKEEALKTLGDSYLLGWHLMVPAALCFYIFAPWGVKLIYEYGKFSASDSVETANLLRFYVLGLPFYGMYKIFVPTFYALERYKLPVICSIFSIFANILFCISLVPKYGHGILALGTTLSITLNVFTQGILLKKVIGLKSSFFLNRSVVKIIVSGALTYFCLNWWVLKRSPLSLGELIGELSLGGAATVTIYLAFLFISGEAFAMIKRLRLS